MAVQLDDETARERVGRVESLLEGLEGMPDPRAAEQAFETVGALLELYGEGLARVLAAMDPAQRTALAGDELVGHLLLLHGLHPVPLEERVEGALDEVRPYLESHDGGVELLGVEEGVVRLRLEGSCSGCPSSRVTLKLAVEDAIHKAAPDVEAIEAEGAAEEPAVRGVALPMAGAPAPAGSNGNGNGAATLAVWMVIGRLDDLAESTTTVRPVGRRQALFAALDGGLYAYAATCPSCAGSLEGAGLDGGELVCPGCAHRFDARRAGRCLDAPQLHLEPLPLLVDGDGTVKVAAG